MVAVGWSLLPPPAGGSALLLYGCLDPGGAPMSPLPPARGCSCLSIGSFGQPAPTDAHGQYVQEKRFALLKLSEKCLSTQDQN